MEKAAVRKGKKAARSEKTVVRSGKTAARIEKTVARSGEWQREAKKRCAKRKTDSEMRNNDSGEQITGIRKLLPLLTE
ncbi:hypothetical protein [Brevibacillus sp. HD3.3A]|uniref:hypothetical protein n=1 Tax=Brevibacillus sp. HD3.3A TaxID=2738979 RepID=UPI00156B0BF7|nr:hypothetical protein [Brevibacillus sp. HD3.3A]UED71555.1 hypothetical protein HP435_13290 [Brevibacillus sp. HD3.3A]